MNGVLVMDKPMGWTSHDVVQKVRGLLREKKIGHTGTLDPIATGILVLCVGKATKLVRYLEADEKEYIAELKLGCRTETQDSTGRILDTVTYVPPLPENVRNVLSGFVGTILQRPPAYSALKIAGVPSYRLARSGTLTEHAERAVTIRRIEMLSFQDPLVQFQVTCSKGTYVRTLCADVGDALGMGAHLISLRRVRAGLFSLEEARTLADLAKAVGEGSAKSLLISPLEALSGMPEVMVEESDSLKIARGGSVPLPPSLASETFSSPIRVTACSRTLLAVGRVRNGSIRPETVLM